MSETLPFTVRVPRDLGLRATALSHGWYQVPPFRWDEDAFALARAERLRPGGPPRWIRVTQPGGPGRPLLGEVHGRDLGPEDAEAAQAVLATCLGADVSLGGFAREAAGRPALQAAVEMGGGRWLRGATLFEDLVKGIACTNVAWSQAIRMIAAVGALGPPADAPGLGPLPCWPTPAEVAAGGDSHLWGTARLGYRSVSILRLAEGAAGGHLDLDGLDLQARRDLPAPDLRRALLAFHGVGPATAAYLMAMRGRCAEVTVDSSTLAFVAATRTGGRRPSVPEVRAMFAPHGEHAGRVAWLEYWLGHARGSPLRTVPFPARAREAVALFDAGRWFEAHEGFEEVWRHLGGPPRVYYQGLVHLAVSAAHCVRGNRYGAVQQAHKAARRVAVTGYEGAAPIAPSVLAEVARVLLRTAERLPEGHVGHAPALPRLAEARGTPRG